MLLYCLNGDAVKLVQKWSNKKSSGSNPTLSVLAGKWPVPGQHYTACDSQKPEETDTDRPAEWFVL